MQAYIFLAIVMLMHEISLCEDLFTLFLILRSTSGNFFFGSYRQRILVGGEEEIDQFNFAARVQCCLIHEKCTKKKLAAAEIRLILICPSLLFLFRPTFEILFFKEAASAEMCREGILWAAVIDTVAHTRF